MVISPRGWPALRQRPPPGWPGRVHRLNVSGSCTSPRCRLRDRGIFGEYIASTRRARRGVDQGRQVHTWSAITPASRPSPVLRVFTTRDAVVVQHGSPRRSRLPAAGTARHLGHPVHRPPTASPRPSPRGRPRGPRERVRRPARRTPVRAGAPAASCSRGQRQQVLVRRTARARRWRPGRPPRPGRRPERSMLPSPTRRTSPAEVRPGRGPSAHGRATSRTWRAGATRPARAAAARFLQAWLGGGQRRGQAGRVVAGRLACAWPGQCIR